MALGVHHDAIVGPRRMQRQCPSAAKCVVDAYQTWLSVSAKRIARHQVVRVLPAG